MSDSLGGKPQATVIGTAHRDLGRSTRRSPTAWRPMPTRPTIPISRGRFHPGCGIVPAALAMAELAGRSGNDLLRAVALGYDVGARLNMALGFAQARYRAATHPQPRHRRSAPLRRPPRCCASIRAQVRHALSYAAQQVSGVRYWVRDPEHVEKAFDFGGMGARNGVTAATMVAAGIHRRRRSASAATSNLFTALGDDADARDARRRARHALRDHATPRSRNGASARRCSRCSIASRRCSRIRSVRAGNIKRIVVDMPADRLHIVDNRTIPDICVQHLVALMIVDGGADLRQRARPRAHERSEGARDPQAGRGWCRARS